MTRRRRPDARKYLGRRIVAVEFNPFDGGRGRTVYDPVLTLDDGARLAFTVEETEVGHYGIAVVYSPPQRKR